jgi:phage tail-like protein
VVAFNDNCEPVAEWTFVDVWPVRYTGPSFSAESAKVAIETFEFAHNGLLG